MTQAISTLRNNGKLDKHGKPYKGLHTVYSGFNGAYRDYFGEGADPVAVTKQLDLDGKIDMVGARGGAMIYLKGEAPERKSNTGIDALAKMGLTAKS